MAKRIFDIAASLVGLLILLPLFVFVALLVKISSKGPIIFSQQRVGRAGKDFTLHKFRTMQVLIGADQGRFDAGASSRVTAVGRILRKFKIDELPQLWNVLKGDMSMVGPRPEIRKWVDAYPERWKTILAVRPGITDPASIKFSNEEEMLSKSSNPERTYRNEILPVKLTLLENYLEQQGFFYDIGLILRTFIKIAAK